MSITQNETRAGAAALKDYIDRMLTANGLAWEEMFIPVKAYVQGADDVIEAADASKDQSAAARLQAGAAALRAALVQVGQSEKVSDTNLIEGTSEVLTAVAKVRAQENPPKPKNQAQMPKNPGGIVGLVPPTPPGAIQTRPQPPQNPLQGPPEWLEDGPQDDNPGDDADPDALPPNPTGVAGPSESSDT
jgi:hypothetical protein